MNILIIEDEIKTAKYLQKGLIEANYFVDVAADGAAGLYLANTSVYDLVLLDLMMPKLDGWGVLKSLRAVNKEIKVIVLSAVANVDEKVNLFNLGADDYIIKPFSFSELLARVKAVLKRTGVTQDSQYEIFSDIVIDTKAVKVTRNHKHIELTVKEYALLRLFIQNANEVLSRNIILDKVWGINFATDTNIVDVTIRRLRKKIDEGFENKLIHSIRGLGYILRYSNDV